MCGIAHADGGTRATPGPAHSRVCVCPIAIRRLIAHADEGRRGRRERRSFSEMVQPSLTGVSSRLTARWHAIMWLACLCVCLVCVRLPRLRLWLVMSRLVWIIASFAPNKCVQPKPGSSFTIGMKLVNIPKSIFGVSTDFAQHECFHGVFLIKKVLLHETGNVGHIAHEPAPPMHEPARGAAADAGRTSQSLVKVRTPRYSRVRELNLKIYCFLLRRDQQN